MKAEKINELIWWAEWKDISWKNGGEDYLYLYRSVSEEILDWLLDFDEAQDGGGTYIICSVYKNIEWKEWYSCIVSRECLWWFNTPEEFAKYVAKLYDRAMEILDTNQKENAH